MTTIVEEKDAKFIMSHVTKLLQQIPAGTANYLVMTTATVFICSVCDNLGVSFDDFVEGLKETWEDPKN